MDKEIIEKSREYLVVKSNDLVLNSRFQYGLIEQKTIAYICSMIKPKKDNLENEYVLEYEFNILDYAAICGLENSGTLYNDVKRALKNIRDKSMWITLDNGDETLISWIDKIRVSPKSGKIKIRIDSDIAPFLFELKTRYLSYGIKNILSMKSGFSIRIYELLKTYLGLQSAITEREKTIVERSNNPVTYEWEIQIDELKRKLMVDNIISYQKDNNKFKLKVLEPAYKEINELTDIAFEYEMLKKSNRVYAVRFTIRYKDLYERSKAEIKNYKLLND